MTEISIKNFQSIKNVDLVVDGFTILRAGKPTALR